MQRSLLLLAITLITFSIIASSAFIAPMPINFAGVLADGPLIDGTVSFAAEARSIKSNGLGWIRLPIAWAAVEPTRSTYQFSKLDAMIGAAAANRLEVVPVVVHAPHWATKAPAAVNASPALSALRQTSNSLKSQPQAN